MLRYNEQRNMENMFDPLNKSENWISQCKSAQCLPRANKQEGKSIHMGCG